MKVSTKFVAHKALAKCTEQETTRYALGGVHVSPATDETVWLTACDGRQMAVLEVEGFTDDAILCPLDIWPTKNKPATVSKNGDWKNSERRWSDEEVDGRYPRTIDVITRPTNRVIEVNLDPELLMKTCAAILATQDESRSITFLIEEPDKGDIAESAIRLVGSSGGYGVVMPMGSDRESKALANWNSFVDRFSSSIIVGHEVNRLTSDEEPESLPAPEPKALPAPEPDIETESAAHHDEFADSVIDAAVVSRTESPSSVGASMASAITKQIDRYNERANEAPKTACLTDLPPDRSEDDETGQTAPESQWDDSDFDF